MFFFFFFFFFIFFFPSSDFYFVEEVRVQSGTPAPARERVAVRYFVEEMGRGMVKAYLLDWAMTEDCLLKVMRVHVALHILSKVLFLNHLIFAGIDHL